MYSKELYPFENCSGFRFIASIMDILIFKIKILIGNRHFLLYLQPVISSIFRKIRLIIYQILMIFIQKRFNS